jgi:hypothetical protein
MPEALQQLRDSAGTSCEVLRKVRREADLTGNDVAYTIFSSSALVDAVEPFLASELPSRWEPGVS